MNVPARAPLAAMASLGRPSIWCASMLPEPVERLALLGWRLHPASRHTKAACIKNAAHLATYDLDRLAAWHREFAPCNWRVTLEGSGIWALDVDVPSPDHTADGMKALHALTVAHGSIPERPMTRSGGGGCALFFAYRGERIIGKTGHPAPGLDPRRGRLSVTVPPSIHVTTKQPYRWITPPWEVTPPPAPAWLLRLLEPAPIPPRRIASDDQPIREDRYAVAALRRGVENVATAPDGARNSTLNQEAWSLSRFVTRGLLSPANIAEALATAARHAGLDRREVEATLASALRARGAR